MCFDSVGSLGSTEKLFFVCVCSVFVAVFSFVRSSLFIGPASDLPGLSKRYACQLHLSRFQRLGAPGASYI